jgi:hypothetical protein
MKDTIIEILDKYKGYDLTDDVVKQAIADEIMHELQPETYESEQHTL